MSLINNLQWRYATKRMNGQKVPQDKLDFILHAIQLAPSSNGLQPYTVLVIENPELKKQLQTAAFNQAQIVESSHLLVFAYWDQYGDTELDTYINHTATKRNVAVESLNDYKAYVGGYLNNLTQEQKHTWFARQAYIALGIGVAAAAEVEVDATPMEGFEPAKFAEILGLKEKGLHPVALLSLGYRSQEDWLAPLPKVRRDKELLFEFL